MKTRRKKPSVRKLVKKLDAIFSVYIRKKYADEYGMVACFTCGKKRPWKEMQNGHYISRRHMATRFLEINAHPQDMACNVFLHGAMDTYALRLQEKYGDGILKELNRLKNQVKQWTVGELESLIERYS